MNTQTRHSTEALARKAARRHGRASVRVILTPGNPAVHSRDQFWVQSVGQILLNPGEILLYSGPGYACPREVTT